MWPHRLIRRLGREGPGLLDVSCCILPWRRAGLRCLAACEGLNDDHGTAAFRARLMDIQIGGIVVFFPKRCLVRSGFCIEQAPDLFDPVAADAPLGTLLRNALPGSDSRGSLCGGCGGSRMAGRGSESGG